MTNPSAEGFCTTAVQNPSAEVRETAAIYRQAPSGREARGT
jgi:hypothetical protein